MRKEEEIQGREGEDAKRATTFNSLVGNGRWRVTQLRGRELGGKK